MVHNFRTDASLPTTPQFFGDNGGRWGSGGVPTKFPAGFGGGFGDAGFLSADAIKAVKKWANEKPMRGGPAIGKKFAGRNMYNRVRLSPQQREAAESFADKGGFMDWAKFARDTEPMAYYFPPKRAKKMTMLKGDKGRGTLSDRIRSDAFIMADSGGVHQLMNRVPYGGPPPFVMGDSGRGAARAAAPRWLKDIAARLPRRRRFLRADK